MFVRGTHVNTIVTRRQIGRNRVWGDGCYSGADVLRSKEGGPRNVMCGKIIAGSCLFPPPPPCVCDFFYFLSHEQVSRHVWSRGTTTLREQQHSGNLFSFCLSFVPVGGISVCRYIMFVFVFFRFTLRWAAQQPHHQLLHSFGWIHPSFFMVCMVSILLFSVSRCACGHTPQPLPGGGGQTSRAS